MPENIGVSPQSCHKVLKLSLKVCFKEPVKIYPDRVNFNLMGSKENYYFHYVLARFQELEYSHLLVDYKLVQNIYNDAKMEILGKFTSKARKRKLSPELKQLQKKFQLALTNMTLYEDNSLVEYAKICDRNLYMLNSQEESEEYSIWL